MAIIQSRVLVYCIRPASHAPQQRSIWVDKHLISKSLIHLCCICLGCKRLADICGAGLLVHLPSYVMQPTAQLHHLSPSLLLRPLDLLLPHLQNERMA